MENRNSETSPLTRGKHIAAHWRGKRLGNIPAHAGKTLTANQKGKGRIEHPRSRGENFSFNASKSNAIETSPLTRGKLAPKSASEYLCRNIPAHAGKTIPVGILVGIPWKHPRSRGENWKAPPPFAPFSETSPLTRGKLQTNALRLLAIGNIPAHAGKTVSGSR